jgi:hypothetical protein
MGGPLVLSDGWLYILYGSGTQASGLDLQGVNVSHFCVTCCAKIGCAARVQSVRCQELEVGRVNLDGRDWTTEDPEAQG